MSSVITREEKQIVRPLKVLVPLIKEDLKNASEAANKAGLPHYISAGAKMQEAKLHFYDGEKFESGEFYDWVKRNFEISRTTAVTWMSYSSEVPKVPARAGSYPSLSDHLRDLGKSPRGAARGGLRAWRQDVDDLAEKARAGQERLERQHEDNMTRQQERAAERLLALKLIDIGYKVLAKELHPDKGGSRDTMQRLSRVRDRLKASA